MDAKRITLAILAGFATTLAAVSAAGVREMLPLDDHWRFFQGEAVGVEQPGFDDTKWKMIALPNDWSIAGPFAKTNLTGGAGAFLPGGVAWYRKHFSLPSEMLGRRVFAQFDGVMLNSDVWINGMHLGHHTNGYTGFHYELPGFTLKFGGGVNNVLTVCADASAPPASSGYAGAGIYRHVRLVATEPVHIAMGGVLVSTPKISAAEATARILTVVANESTEPGEISVQTSLLAPDGDPVGFLESSQTIGAGAGVTLEQQIAFPNPQLWNPDAPKFYRAISKLRVEGQMLDEQTTTFDVRDAHFEAGTGFWLNGKNLELKGVCLHADGGAFGAAVPLSIWEARLKTLKSLGVNAIRTAYHPPAPEIQDLCDHLGLLLMDEFPDQTAVKDFHDPGIDYLGDSPRWPMVGHDSGLLDRTGAIRPLSRDLESRWSDAPMVAIARRASPTLATLANPDNSTGERQAQVFFSDWTPENLKPHSESVEVWSNCKQVELFLNRKSLGKKEIHDGAAPRDWLVPFVPGVLKAVARDGQGWPAATNELRTSRKPASIVLRTLTKTLAPVWDDVAIVRATIVDSKGVTTPRAGDLLKFTISGPGVIAAVDNADNASHELFQTNSRHAFQGECVAFVKASAGSGKIILTAAAAGLKTGSIVIRAAPKQTK